MYTINESQTTEPSGALDSLNPGDSQRKEDDVEIVDEGDLLSGGVDEIEPALLYQADGVEGSGWAGGGGGGEGAGKKEGGAAAGGEKGAPGEPCFNPDLGLAMEKLPPGMSLERLWSVV